jgi:hypothetical protein
VKICGQRTEQSTLSGAADGGGQSDVGMSVVTNLKNTPFIGQFYDLLAVLPWLTNNYDRVTKVRMVKPVSEKRTFESWCSQKTANVIHSTWRGSTALQWTKTKGEAL